MIRIDDPPGVNTVANENAGFRQADTENTRHRFSRLVCIIRTPEPAHRSHGSCLFAMKYKLFLKKYEKKLTGIKKCWDFKKG